MHLLEQYDLADAHYQGLLRDVSSRLDQLSSQTRRYPDDEAVKLGLLTRIGVKNHVLDYVDLTALLLSQYDPLFALATARELRQFKRALDPMERVARIAEEVWQGGLKVPEYVLDCYPDLLKVEKNPSSLFDPAAMFLSAHVVFPVAEREDVLLARGRYAKLTNPQMKEAVERILVRTDEFLGRYITL